MQHYFETEKAPLCMVPGPTFTVMYISSLRREGGPAIMLAE
ncbi:Short chain dehydrogenase [Giardia duodenalis assemblage B]|uniref:Short chain dehydrogenase n=2 Tax=Giardia intestinalis TaxID=5741 RepID=A0A132NVP6_GIAIN|nr:Short chain dehydrogenase [Giardia intestinalis]KWX14156.1 Short chain dehydrogenase [Giardia intestinalis assemblage B]